MSISQILHNKIENAMVGLEDNEKFLAIDLIHQKVHEGKMLFASKTFAVVASGATVYIRHVSGPTKYIHSLLTIRTMGQWDFTSYSGTTYSGAGTVMPILNRKSNSTYIPEAVFRHTPTIDVLGTPRLNFKFGGGTNPAQTSTGIAEERLESDFAPNTDVLIALKNESGANQYISFVFDFYEEV